MVSHVSFSGTNDLAYLTSAQQLYDVARFVRSMQAAGRTGPWITFGGSYGGERLSVGLRVCSD